MEINSDLNDKNNIHITTHDLNNQLKDKKKKFQEDIFNKTYNTFYNHVQYKTQLLNIDSRYRDTITKNIFCSFTPIKFFINIKNRLKH